MAKFKYNDKQSSTLVQARAKKWKAMKTKTAFWLTRDEDSFRQHLLRAIYQAKIWCDFESALAPEHPQHNKFDCVTFNGKYLLPVCHVLQNLNIDESNSDSESNSDESSNEDLCQRDETDDDDEEFSAYYKNYNWSLFFLWESHTFHIKNIILRSSMYTLKLSAIYFN